MAYEIIDTPANVTRYLPKLPGITTVIRYITRGSPNGSKHVKLPEVQAIKAAGKKLAIVHETFGDFAHAGRGGISAADGVADGKYSRAVMPKLGAPAGACVYFAVDCDASPSQLKNNVLPYFKNVRAAFEDGEYRVGVYGPGVVCQAVQDAGFADLFWLSNAKGWKGYAAFKPKADLLQLLPTHVAGGLDVDPDVAQSEDWGNFEPFADDADIVTGAVTEPDGQPMRLGQGDTAADSGEAVASMGGNFDSIKSLFKSKIAWSAGALGGGAATSSLTNDPDTLHLFSQLLSHSALWIALGCIAVAGTIVYFRWKEHGRGQVS